MTGPAGGVVTVFGSALPPQGHPEYLLAGALGRELAAAGFALCNGGYGGTMEAAARGAQEAGGTTTGVVFSSSHREPNRWLDRVITASTLLERLQELLRRGDAYVVLRGGTGTLLELAAAWETMEKGVMRRKPLVLLGAFWEPVIRTVRSGLEGRDAAAGPPILRAPSPRACARILLEHFDKEPHAPHAL
ncbi:MAG: LOG family protein [Bacteroidota bacterium]